ncbi:plastocyanin [Actinobacillus succinogenes]|uniref:SmpA/OmlA domain protein n=1 Tax=Actinobacillus succinogenes (strain ATCC 55618 / DSM 22257 / CCUG 43843 / 130Z) TaxID=339671 RepID=A6VNT9_ACTSZ|nr:OmpA family protein [Actinobacillus succinogenes]ABR74636.1 SmpA/OmlA domain protein [Actinobacillus succinogenes 130Z]PHI40939.1 plastocyanin [Actinobacillus succinogenes]
MKLSRLLLSTTAAVVLAACGNLSDITEDGLPAGDTPEQAMANLVWPKIDDARFNHDGSQFGSWPNWDNVRMVERGMNKDQIANLLGRPHFSEGLYGVREWDYAFNYRENGVHKICQYKVLFDKNMNAQSFFWYPNGCNGYSSFHLSGDFLFDFDKDTLTTEGKKVVDNVASQLKSSEAKEVSVAGYTDRLGSDAYNLDLSQRRADRVKNRLIEQGVSAQITATGYGKANQVKACEGERGQALINCLHPNRRVEIKSSGTVLKQAIGGQTNGGKMGPKPLYNK